MRQCRKCTLMKLQNKIKVSFAKGKLSVLKTEMLVQVFISKNCGCDWNWFNGKASKNTHINMHRYKNEVNFTKWID